MGIDINGEFVSAISGAFLGAISAFTLGAYSNRKAESDRKYDAILRAQLTLMQHLRLLKSFKLSTGPYAFDLANRHLTTPRSVDPPSFARLDVPSLSFLISMDRNNANLMNELMKADDDFEMFLDASFQRNRILDEMNIAAQNAKFDPINSNIQALAPKIIIYRLKNRTDIMYDMMDRSLIRTNETFRNLLKAAKNGFNRKGTFARKRTFLTFIDR